MRITAVWKVLILLVSLSCCLISNATDPAVLLSTNTALKRLFDDYSTNGVLMYKGDLQKMLRKLQEMRCGHSHSDDAHKDGHGHDHDKQEGHSHDSHEDGHGHDHNKQEGHSHDPHGHELVHDHNEQEGRSHAPHKDGHGHEHIEQKGDSADPQEEEYDYYYYAYEDDSHDSHEDGHGHDRSENNVLSHDPNEAGHGHDHPSLPHNHQHNPDSGSGSMSKNDEKVECDIIAHISLGNGLKLNESFAPATFVEMCPSILLSLMTTCVFDSDLADPDLNCENNHGHNHNHHGHGHGHGNSQCDYDGEAITKVAWISAIGSLVIIGLVAVSCILLIPTLKKTRYFKLINHFLLSLAVGTLSGDALIHLIPHALSDKVSIGTNPHLTDALLGFVAFLGIITFFILQNIQNIVGHSHKHSHKHSQQFEKMNHEDNNIDHAAIELQKISQKNKSLRNMLVLGDGLHTFMDGLAVGAAFGSSLTGGIATAIAVLCHELPHELGDFAILFELGLSRLMAFKIAAVLWLLSFVGMIAGVFIGSIPAVSPWIHCYTAGVFLYLALVILLGALATLERIGNSFGQICLEVTGMLSGAVIMIIIAIYEHDMEDFFYKVL